MFSFDGKKVYFEDTTSMPDVHIIKHGVNSIFTGADTIICKIMTAPLKKEREI